MGKDNEVKDKWAWLGIQAVWSSETFVLSVCCQDQATPIAATLTSSSAIRIWRCGGVYSDSVHLFSVVSNFILVA